MVSTPDFESGVVGSKVTKIPLGARIFFVRMSLLSRPRRSSLFLAIENEGGGVIPPEYRWRDQIMP